MRASLKIEAGEGVPAFLELPPDQPVSLGRNRGNTIVLHDRHASRWHAEVLRDSGRWLLRDCCTLNGTKLNGERIQGDAVLQNGHLIGIGDTLLRFHLHLDDAATDETPNLVMVPEPGANGHPPPPSSEFSSTTLHADELTVLCNFMNASVEEACHHALIRRALQAVQNQVQATVTGFLSLDPSDPLPKVVLPELAHVDFHLSRQLTRRAEQEGRPVWLKQEEDPSFESESLMLFQDALCIPLRAGEETLGALHVYKVGKLFTEREARFCEVLAGYLANSLRVLRSRRTLEAENSRLRGHQPAAGDDLVGTSPALEQVRQQIERFAPRPHTVLIVGESGVGKELVALALHRRSPRREGPLVIVNCAAISPTLIESELFGHCKGTFTGAEADRPGFFQQADEGTLFLDEIGDMPLECQAKLLRVLDGKGFRPVGATQDVYPDVRVVAATHRDLDVMVREKKFRHDLRFRLSMEIRVPPLRERAEDVPALVQHFLPRLSADYRRPLRLTPSALRRLQTYSWPGNVRQLRAVLENAVAMTDSPVIEADDLLLPDEHNDPSGQFPSLNLEALEAWAIRQALVRSKGNLSQAARVLDIHRDTLHAKMKKYNIDREA